MYRLSGMGTRPKITRTNGLTKDTGEICILLKIVITSKTGTGRNISDDVAVTLFTTVQSADAGNVRIKLLCHNEATELNQVYINK